MNFPRSLVNARSKSTLLTSGNVHQCKQSDPGVSVYGPFLGLAVWLAAVVHESGLVSFRSGVNYAVLPERNTR